MRAKRAAEGRELAFDPAEPCVHGLMTANEVRHAGQFDKARKIFEQVIAKCPEKEIVKMAKTELEQMQKLNQTPKK